METTAAAKRAAGGHDAAPHSTALLHGLLHHPEGRAVWEGRIAPLAGRLGLAALASACRAGRDYRRGRVQGGEELLRLNKHEAYQSLGEMRAVLALGGLELNNVMVYNTARHGTAEALAWLIDSTEAIEMCYTPFVWRDAAMAESERVAKLEVLHERIPGEWGWDAAGTAARYGHTDALAWLHEHDAPWSVEDCLRRAHEHGHQHVVAWIEQQLE